MNKLIGLILAGALGTALSTAAFATEYTKGTVKKIDLKGKKVTIIHEELKNLDMPAMTMVFRMADDAMLEKVQEGQEIEFSADRVNGNLTVIELKE
ncbi:copper-binding protein [Roseibium sp. M-1]